MCKKILTKFPPTLETLFGPPVAFCCAFGSFRSAPLVSFCSCVSGVDATAASVLCPVGVLFDFSKTDVGGCGDNTGIKASQGGTEEGGRGVDAPAFPSRGEGLAIPGTLFAFIIGDGAPALPTDNTPRFSDDVLALLCCCVDTRLYEGGVCDGLDSSEGL